MGSKRINQLFLAAFFSSSLVVGKGAVAQQEAAAVLVEQGTYWQERGDSTRAIEAWEKLLLLEQQEAVALKGLVEAHINAKKYGKAREYLNKLKNKYPENRAIPELEQNLRLQESNQNSLLEEARLLAASGELEEALAKYEELFQGARPEGNLAREYYGYLGYTKGGMSEAIAGLQRLEQLRPNDPQVALLLARHLARQESTRLQGVERLQRLAQRPDIGSDAAESWRDAILWLGPASKEAEPYFRSYLNEYPNDDEVKALLAQGITIRTAPPASTQVTREDPLQRRGQQALKSLNANPHQAEGEFLAILKQRPRDSNALGGLGIIRLRQGKLAEAQSLLKRANAINKRGWGQALQQVEFQLSLEKAQQLQSQGKSSQAESVYLQLLEKEPKSMTLLNSLADLMIEQNRLEEARTYLMRLEPIVGETTDSAAQAAFTVTVARFDIALGDKERAISDLELALVRYPSNPWVRLELALLYLEQGNQYDAENTMRGIAISENSSKDVFKAWVLFASAQKDWARAIQLVDELPKAYLDSDFQNLKRQAVFQQQVLWAKQRCILGYQADALDVLAQQTTQLADDTTLVMVLVDAYLACEQNDKAQQLIDRQLLVATLEKTVELNLLKVGLFLKERKTREAESLLIEIAQQPLNSNQVKRYEELSLYLAIQQAEALRLAGRSEVALKGLEPLMSNHPDNFDLALMLVQLHMDKGDKREALKLYDKVLASSISEKSSSVQLNLARMAYQVGNRREAERILDGLVISYSDNTEVLTQIAQTYRQQGRLGRAAAVIKQAMQAYQKTVNN